MQNEIIDNKVGNSLLKDGLPPPDEDEDDGVIKSVVGLFGTKEQEI